MPATLWAKSASERVMNSSARSFGMMAKAMRSVSAPLTTSNGVWCR